jgi:hypothetical protein
MCTDISAQILQNIVIRAVVAAGMIIIGVQEIRSLGRTDFHAWEQNLK